MKKEFFRCGFYVYNGFIEQTEENLLIEDKNQINLEKIERRILADKPRITRFDIDWNNDPNKVCHSETQFDSFENKENLVNNKEDKTMLEEKQLNSEKSSSDQQNSVLIN